MTDDLTFKVACRLYEGAMFDARDMLALPFPETEPKHQRFYLKRAAEILELLAPQLDGASTCVYEGTRCALGVTANPEASLEPLAWDE